VNRSASELWPLTSLGHDLYYSLQKIRYQVGADRGESKGIGGEGANRESGMACF